MCYYVVLDETYEDIGLCQPMRMAYEDVLWGFTNFEFLSFYVIGYDLYDLKVTMRRLSLFSNRNFISDDCITAVSCTVHDTVGYFDMNKILRITYCKVDKTIWKYYGSLITVTSHYEYDILVTHNQLMGIMVGIFSHYYDWYIILYLLHQNLFRWAKKSYNYSYVIGLKS